MNSFFLAALKARLAEDLASLYLSGVDSEDPVLHPVKIYIGNLPTAQSDVPDPQPFVLLIPVSGDFHLGENEIRIDCTCGIFNPEEGDAEGVEMDMAVLLSALASSLVPCSKTPLEGRYRLTEGSQGRLLSWTKSTVQARPYAETTMATYWRMKGVE